MDFRNVKTAASVTVLFLVILFSLIFHPRVLTWLGDLLVSEGRLETSEAAVVLNTGVELYPRLMEAAALYREGYVGRVVINGNRKSDALRRLEKIGFETCCPWHEDAVRILSLLGVPRENIVPVDAEDAYDTVSEAEAVGKRLIEEKIARIIVVTSKSHTGRAGRIWRRMYGDSMTIRTAAAREDPYDPKAWWKEGRQIRWVMAEYGAWIYLIWKTGFKI